MKWIPLMLILLASAGTAHAVCSITSGNATGQVGTAFTYSITVTGGNASSYGASNLPPGLSVDTPSGVISGTPTTAGPYTVHLTITCSNGNSSKDVTFTINARPSPTPTATATATFTPTATATATFTPTPSATFTPTATATATFTPTATATATFTATATATATFTPTPTPCNTITSPLTATGTVGVSFSYTITATNTNNQTTYAASPLPPGLALGNGSNRNVISGTPTTPGITSVQISVSNGPPCTTVSATLVITISGPNPTPTATPAVTPTATPTATPTGTPTGTPIPGCYSIVSAQIVTSGSFYKVGDILDPLFGNLCGLADNYGFRLQVVSVDNVSTGHVLGVTVVAGVGIGYSNPPSNPIRFGGSATGTGFTANCTFASP